MSTTIEMNRVIPASEIAASATDASPEVSRVQWHVPKDEQDGLLTNEALSPSRMTQDEDDHIHCKVKKYEWSPPAGSENRPYRQHQGEGSQYLRDFILGVNDGIISTFLLVVGLVAGGSGVTLTLLSAISAAVAGAIAMGLGEYIATKSQENVNKGEFELEEEHFKYHRDVELEQLRGFLTEVGLKDNLLEAVVAEVGREDTRLMKIMMAFEFGASGETAERNPLYAMWTSGRLFLMGALPTVIPFFCVKDPFQGLYIAGILVAVALFAVGVYKSRTTMGNPWWEGFENFIFGVIGTAISFAVGVAFQKASGGNAAY